MSKWPTTRLPDVAEIIMGQSPPGNTYNETGDGLPFFQGKTEFGEVSPTPRKWCNAPKKIAEAGDILMSVRAPVGPTNLAVTQCCIGRGLAAIRANPELLDPSYLRFALRHAEPQLASMGQGSTFAAISRAELAITGFPLPPLTEQRRIVDILARAEGIVRLRSEAKKKAAELIPTLFLDMFGDPATNPKGWPVEMLPDVLAFPFKNGLYLPKEKYAAEGSSEGVEMVHMSNAFYGEVKRGGLRRVLAEERQIRDYSLSKNDLLVARRSLTFDGAAKLCGIPASDEPLLFESSFIRLIPDAGKVRTEYLLYYLNDENTRRAHILSRISGITISGINQAALNQTPVMIPPLAKQGNFVERVSEVRSIQSQQSAATSTAQATFYALLSQVFAG